MTFDDDSIVLMGPYGGHGRLLLKALGLEWPPPERLIVEHEYGTLPNGTHYVVARAREPSEQEPSTAVWRQRSCSQLTDEERAGMDYVFRGAEYELEALPAEVFDR